MRVTLLTLSLMLGIVSCGSDVPAPIPLVPSAKGSRELTASDLSARGIEADRRRDRITAEIDKSKSALPWAGVYIEGDGFGENVRLALAPESGCVATWNGCMGLYGANWGSVTVTDGKLHIAFEHPNTPGKFGHFFSEYTIEDVGENRILRPPGHATVLRAVPRSEW